MKTLKQQVIDKRNANALREHAMRRQHYIFFGVAPMIRFDLDKRGA